MCQVVAVDVATAEEVRCNYVSSLHNTLSLQNIYLRVNTLLSASHSSCMFVINRPACSPGSRPADSMHCPTYCSVTVPVARFTDLLPVPAGGTGPWRRRPLSNCRASPAACWHGGCCALTGAAPRTTRECWQRYRGPRRSCSSRPISWPPRCSGARRAQADAPVLWLSAEEKASPVRNGRGTLNVIFA